MNRSIVGGVIVVSFFVLAGCSHAARPPVAPSGAAKAPTASAQQSKVPDNSTSGTVAISDQIRHACGISDEDEYFAFNSAHLETHAHSVLDKLATCFDTGPLKGRSMKLVGRADPRGDAEYNMVLGGRRASSVQMALVHLGMKRGRITTSSRGAMDATGTDPAGWAKDRRVDVMLGS